MNEKEGGIDRRRFLKSSASGVAGVGMLYNMEKLFGKNDEEKVEMSKPSVSQSGAKRTLIKGRWIVGFDGREHRLIHNGVVVYEGDKIVHVGKRFDGKADEVIEAEGRLVIPGLINIHAVSSIDIVHFTIDGQRGGSPSTKTKMLDGIANPRYYFTTEEELRTSAEFSLACLLKGGATTIGEITSFGSTGFNPNPAQVEILAETAESMGARMYLSQPYTDMKNYTDASGTHYHFDEAAGRRGLEDAVRFCKEYEGTQEDRIRTMLFPYMFDTCSEGLLKATRRTADVLGVPIHMHTSQYLPEFYEIIRRHGKTPVHFLRDIGFLGPKTILTHLLYTSLNPVTPAPGRPLRDPQDVEILAGTETTLGHTPAVWARIGLPFHSYARYRDAGVNIAIGTDAFPMDMFMEMRTAAIMSKGIERDRSAATARDVFNASTLGGAKALDRTDLGRLEPGAKADIVVVDLTGLHTALTHDPIKTMVYWASQSDIETVIVDGRKVVEKGRIPGLDEEKLAREADEINYKWAENTGQTYWASLKDWEGR